MPRQGRRTDGILRRRQGAKTPGTGRSEPAGPGRLASRPVPWPLVLRRRGGPDGTPVAGQARIGARSGEAGLPVRPTGSPATAAAGPPGRPRSTPTWRRVGAGSVDGAAAARGGPGQQAPP